MKRSESKHVEFKETITNTMLKTVSAFLNDEGGTILIGVTDDGVVVGLDEKDEARLKLEQKINSAITPRPAFTLEWVKIEGKQILELNVPPGEDAPYYYQSKAYLRNDTSTTPVDGIQLTRLILKNKNLSYDQLSVSKTSLAFQYLNETMKRTMNISQITKSVYISLGLYDGKNYNNAAALLADNHSLSQSVVDLAKFKLTEDVFEDRARLTHASLLYYFDTSMKWFERYYKTWETVGGRERKTLERIPLIAFKEALANAIVHRDYLLSAGIKVGMYDNRIEITSPGGLPEGMSESVYLNGMASVPRNPIITMVLFRLGLIEHFGTGIQRILKSYQGSTITPSFMIQDEMIKIILPVLGYDYTSLREEDAILAYLKAFPNATRADIEAGIHGNKARVIRKINELIKQHKVEVIGQGPNTHYQSLA